MQVMRTLSQNMAYLLKVQTAANSEGIAKPEYEETVYAFYKIKTAVTGGFGFVSAQCRLRFFRFEKVRRCLKTI